MRVSHFTAYSEWKPNSWTSRYSAGVFLNQCDPGNGEMYAPERAAVSGSPLKGLHGRGVDKTPHRLCPPTARGRAPLRNSRPTRGHSIVTSWDACVPAALSDVIGVSDKSSSYVLRGHVYNSCLKKPVPTSTANSLYIMGSEVAFRLFFW